MLGLGVLFDEFDGSREYAENPGLAIPLEKREEEEN
jgi:hypothetical protein